MYSSKFKQSLLLLIALLAVGGSLAVLWFELGFGTGETHAEILVPSTYALDVGDVKQCDIPGNITLTNHSDTTIELVHIVKTCRCSEVNASAKEVLPGQSVHLEIDWDTRGMRGRGRSDFVVFYRPKGESEAERLDLSIFGNVVPEFDIVPNRLVFREKGPSEQTIKLIPRTPDVQVSLTGMRSEFPALQFKKISDQESVIVFEPKDWFADPLHPQIRVTLETDSSKEPTYVLPISVEQPAS